MTSILLENIKVALDEKLIDESQALYIMFAYQKLPMDISPESLLALTKLKYIVGGKVGRILLSQESSIIDVVAGTIKPNYINDISAEIPKKLVRMLGVKDPESGGLHFPGSEDTINDTARKYLGNEGLIAYHYMIFLYLFPIKGKSNRKWERHFTSFEYNGPRLRLRSAASGRKFKNMAKKYDMGAFLYGTYLFIKSGCKENKTFIKSVNNYLKEFQEWYDEALVAIKKADSIEDLFKDDNNAREGRLSVAL